MLKPFAAPLAGSSHLWMSRSRAAAPFASLPPQKNSNVSIGTAEGWEYNQR